MGFLKFKGSVGQYGSIKDYNTINATGFYRITGSTLDGIPNNPNIYYGVMFHFEEQFTLQVAFDLEKSKFCYRIRNEKAVWSAWFVL